MFAKIKKSLVLACYRTLVRRRRNRIGASVARIGYALWILCLYLQSLEIRDFIWGEAGPLPYELFQAHVEMTGDYSLFTYSASPVWLNVLLAAGIASAVFMLLGLFTRTAMILSTVLLWSFHARNPYILDGGDNAGRIFIIFLLFMSCADYASVDSRRLGRPYALGLRNLVHNAAFYFIQIQLCVLYFSSSLNKVTGQLWQNGTALYYVLMSEEYSNPAFGPWLADNYVFITLASYATIGLQLSFPYLVWSRRFRVPVICGLILMHLGIGFQMGLARFSLVMISTLLLLIPNEAYGKFGRVLTAGWRLPARLFRVERITPDLSSLPAPPAAVGAAPAQDSALCQQQPEGSAGRW
jgi:hypothetical protein